MADSKITLLPGGVAIREQGHAQLSDLPLELVQMIVEHLIPDTKAISKFSRTCRGYNEAACIYLHRNVVIRNRQDPGWWLSLNRFPQVVDHVRDFTIHFHKARPARRYAPVLTRYLGQIQSFSNLEKLTIKATGYGVPGTYLHSLHGQFLFNDMFYRTTWGNLLSKLKTLNLNLSDNDQTWPCNIDALLCHPTLEKLSLAGAEIICNARYLPNNHTTALEELVLLSCDHTAGLLTMMLAIPKSLRRFTMKSTPRGSYIGSWLHHDAAEYVNAMAQQQETLETIDFDLVTVNENTSDPLKFELFAALRHLTIRPQLLYGRSIISTPLNACHLPANLRHLTLWWTTLRVTPDLQTNVGRDLHHWLVRGALPSFHTLTYQSTVQCEGGYPGLEVMVGIFWREIADHDFFPVDCQCCMWRLR